LSAPPIEVDKGPAPLVLTASQFVEPDRQFVAKIG